MSGEISMKQIEQPRPFAVPEWLWRSAGWIMGLDRLVHEPSRLAILTIVRDLGKVEYLSLKECVGLSKGNLSNHLAKLEEAEMVLVEKHFEGKKPVTTVRLTGRGSEVMEAYWSNMKHIADGSPKVVERQQAIKEMEGS